MKLIGFTKSAWPHFAVTASHFVDFSHVDPNFAAKKSTTAKPILCRVSTYSGPGFPRPATRRIRDCKFLLLLFFLRRRHGRCRRGGFAFRFLLCDHFRSGSCAFRRDWQWFFFPHRVENRNRRELGPRF